MRTFATALALVLTLGAVSGLAQTERIDSGEGGLIAFNEPLIFDGPAELTYTWSGHTVFSDPDTVVIRTSSVDPAVFGAVISTEPEVIVVENGSTVVLPGNLPAVRTIVVAEGSHLTVNGDLSENLTTLFVGPDSSLTVNGEFHSPKLYQMKHDTGDISQVTWPETTHLVYGRVTVRQAADR